MNLHDLLLAGAVCLLLIYCNRLAIWLAKVVLVAIIVWVVATEILHII